MRIRLSVRKRAFATSKSAAVEYALLLDPDASSCLMPQAGTEPTRDRVATLMAHPCMRLCVAAAAAAAAVRNSNIVVVRVALCDGAGRQA